MHKIFINYILLIHIQCFTNIVDNLSIKRVCNISRGKICKGKERKREGSDRAPLLYLTLKVLADHTVLPAINSVSVNMITFSVSTQIHLQFYFMS